VLTNVTNRQTDTPTYKPTDHDTPCVAIDRYRIIAVAVVTMRPNNKNKCSRIMFTLLTSYPRTAIVSVHQVH